MEIDNNFLSKAEQYFIQDTFSKLSPEERNKALINMKEELNMIKSEIDNKPNLLKNMNKLKNPSLNSFERMKSWMFIQFFSMKAQNAGFFVHGIDNQRKNFIKAVNEGKIKLTKENILSLTGQSRAGLFFNFMNNGGKVFNLSSELKNLIQNTDVSIEYSRCPYNYLFMDLNSTFIGRYEILGIFIRDCVATNEDIVAKEGDDKGVLDILAIGVDTNDGESIWFFDTISEFDRTNTSAGYEDNYIGDKDWTEWISIDDEKKLKILIKKIVCNFLNLINHPEVELVNCSKKLLRESRIQKGKLGVPDEVEINLTGKLKKYISERSANREKAWEIGHRFWVRGHWMEFKDKRYKNMLGKKIWIPEYIKGKGELIKKDYYIGEKEQEWENEKKMFKLIQQVFPDKNLEHHNRTALDGLEIDCYVPELKLGFEYNGQQHYEHIEVFHKTKEDFENQIKRDQEKLRRAQEKGIKIITIKYDEVLTEELIRSKLP